MRDCWTVFVQIRSDRQKLVDLEESVSLYHYSAAFPGISRTRNSLTVFTQMKDAVDRGVCFE
jgi:hypothetical protein